VAFDFIKIVDVDFTNTEQCKIFNDLIADCSSPNHCHAQAADFSL
jgi:hypothetical protein